MSFAIHEHWEKAFGNFPNWYRVRDHFDLINGFPFKSESFNADGIGKPLVRIRDLLSDHLPTFYDGEEGGDIVVNNGDIVIGMDGDFNSVTWVKGEALINQRVCALRARPGSRIDPRILGYQLPLSLKIINDLTPWSTVKHLSSLDVLSLRFPKFDLATQRQIADFLDRETARIDLLIEKKQRFINVLSQKWAAQVTFLLTNGLSPDVPRKDSGISWIGSVPAHWSIAKLGHIGRCANGINIGGGAFGRGFPFVSYGDVYRNPALPNGVEGLVQSSAEDRVRYSLKAGDILFTRTSEIIEEVGFSSVCEDDMPDAVYAGFLIRFRPVRGRLTPQFSKFLFRNERLRAYFSKEMMIVTRASLSQSLLQRMPVVLPPLEEQREISLHLQNSEDAFMAVSEKTRASINRLKEYRSTLITAAVTGQIDVETYAKPGTAERQLETFDVEASQ